MRNLRYHNTHRYLFFLYISIVLFFIILLAALFFEKTVIKIIDLHNIPITTSGYNFNIDEQTNRRSTLKNICYITVRGWIYKPGEDISTYDCDVLLYDSKNNTFFKLPTQLQRRTDVTTHFQSDRKDYNMSGFFAKGLLFIKHKGTGTTKYQLAFRYFNNSNEIIFITNQAILMH